MYAELGMPMTSRRGADDLKDVLQTVLHESHLCRIIVDDGTNVGSALVGSDDKVAVTFEVTAPPSARQPTTSAWLTVTGRMSYTDVEDFNLEPSIKVVPSSANTGDTVNVFAQDFSNDRRTFSTC